MKTIPFYHTQIPESSFWGEKQSVSRRVTLWAVYDRFLETKRFEALKCDGAAQQREGWSSHVFWDSDVAKWIEGAAYVLERGRDERIEGAADAMIDDICRSQRADGYYNCYYNVYETDRRFTDRTDHELYCLGHLIEAAVAYYHATGKDRLLRMTERYVDLVIRVFQKEGSAAFVTPGHEEIELALVRLYRATNRKKYLELASFFIDQRGCNDKDPRGFCSFALAPYAQDHLPVRKQRTAEGHSVRAAYLYAAMADLAALTGDGELFDACDALFRNMTEKRMYITGGIGSSHIGETFTVDYDLPNERAYSETCAAIGLALFAGRMSAIRPLGLYGDAAERALYNGILSGVSIGGDRFFYENPLAVDLTNRDKNPSTKEKERFPSAVRARIFGCSCCPPNLLRFVQSAADLLYSEEGDALYVHHYMSGYTEFEGRTIRQTTAYPADGKVTLETTGYQTVAVRIPGWCDCFEASAPYEEKDGYAYFRGESRVEFDFHIRPVFAAASPRVHENAGKAALTYGPVVYCLEGTDNGVDIFACSVDVRSGVTAAYDPYFHLPVLTAEGFVRTDGGILYPRADSVKYEKRMFRFIPYYGMENRGETDMTVWLPIGRPAE